MKLNPRQLDQLDSLRRKRKELDDKITAIEGGIKTAMKEDGIKVAEATSTKGMNWRFTFATGTCMRLDTKRVQKYLGDKLPQYQKESLFEKFIAKII